MAYPAHVLQLFLQIGQAFIAEQYALKVLHDPFAFDEIVGTHEAIEDVGRRFIVPPVASMLLSAPPPVVQSRGLRDLVLETRLRIGLTWVGATNITLGGSDVRTDRSRD